MASKEYVTGKNKWGGKKLAVGRGEPDCRAEASRVEGIPPLCASLSQLSAKPYFNATVVSNRQSFCLGLLLSKEIGKERVVQLSRVNGGQEGTIKKRSDAAGIESTLAEDGMK